MSNINIIALCIGAALACLGSLVFGLGVEGWASAARERRRLLVGSFYSWGNVEDIRRARGQTAGGLIATAAGAALVVVALT